MNLVSRESEPRFPRGLVPGLEVGKQFSSSYNFIVGLAAFGCVRGSGPLLLHEKNRQRKRKNEEVGFTCSCWKTFFGFPRIAATFQENSLVSVWYILSRKPIGTCGGRFRFNSCPGYISIKKQKLLTYTYVTIVEHGVYKS